MVVTRTPLTVAPVKNKRIKNHDIVCKIALQKIQNKTQRFYP